MKVFVKDILHVEGLKEYVRIVTDTQKIVYLESLMKLEEILPSSSFIRVHKSYIVAKNRVRALHGNMLELHGVNIPLSRRKREQVIKQLFGDAT